MMLENHHYYNVFKCFVSLVSFVSQKELYILRN